MYDGLEPVGSTESRFAFDVIVAGSGPAGAVMAILLRRLGWTVALMEAHRQKAAGVGETLPPECNPLLRSLRLWEALQNSAPIESPGIVSRWGHPAPTEQDFLSNPHGTGWHVDRTRFDGELCTEAVHSGRRCFEACPHGSVCAGMAIGVATGSAAGSSSMRPAVTDSAWKVPHRARPKILCSSSPCGYLMPREALRRTCERKSAPCRRDGGTGLPCRTVNR